MNGEKARVGIVGVGRMGLAMLKHLVKQGYQVTACDIDDKQLAKARDAGAAAVATPAEVARAADFVIVAVGYDDEVRQVVLEVDGLLANLAPSSIIAVSSTAKPDTVKALDEQAKANGVAILDAPICRGRFAADDGTLLALVGGKPDVVERGRPIYRCFCSDYAHLGEVGHGQVGKTMNNLLLWINAVGLIEAGRLAETTGIDLVKLRAALLISSGSKTCRSSPTSPIRPAFRFQSPARSRNWSRRHGASRRQAPRPSGPEPKPNKSVSVIRNRSSEIRPRIRLTRVTRIFQV